MNKVKTTSQLRFAIKIAGWLLLLTVLGTAAFSAWVEYQLRSGRGQFTPEIDTSDIKPLYGTYVIENVNVLNPTATAFLPNQDVVIKNGVIAQLGNATELSPDWPTVNGEGRYLIPGLMDGHVHVNETRNNLWLFIANGVTHVRDMGGTDYHLSVRNTNPKEKLVPDMFVSSQKIYDALWWRAWFKRWTRSRITISNTNQAHEIVSNLVERGFDGLKISNFLTAEQYFELANAAQKQGLLITGHIPNNIALDKVLESGQQEIAHIEELTKAFAREYQMRLTHDFSRQTVDDYLDYVRSRSDEVAQTIKANEIHVTSVIWLMESLTKQKFELEQFLKSVELAYVDPHNLEGWPLSKGWLPGHHSYASSPYWLETPKRREQLRLFWDAYVEAIHIMAQALTKHKVPFTAGTDALTAGTVPGFSLHDELESMVNLGMTNAQALQTATINPGNWLKKIGKGKQSGQIRQGDPANLVLLNKNPLENINNTREIESVVVHGRLLNRKQLDTILSRIKTINDEERTIDIQRYLNYETPTS